MYNQELVQLVGRLLTEGKVAHTFSIRETGEEYKTVFIPSSLLKELDATYRKVKEMSETNNQNTTRNFEEWHVGWLYESGTLSLNDCFDPNTWWDKDEHGGYTNQATHTAWQFWKATVKGTE